MTRREDGAPAPRFRHPDWPLWALALGVALALFQIAASVGPLGRLLAGVLGAVGDEAPAFAARAALALGGAALAFAVGWLAGLLSFRHRVVVVWLGLLGCFAAFAYNFDLKYSLIEAKLPYLAGFALAPDGFVQGAVLTLLLSVVSIACSTVLGFAAGLGRMSSNAVAFGVATFYISFFRGTPLLLQIYLIYLGLAQQLNLVLAAVPSGIIALSLNYGAYLAEINRAGIESVAKGQREAATALGLRRGAILWLVVLPQAMRVIIPPTFGQFIAMLKDSSLVSLLGVWELMFLARSYGRSDFRYMEMLLTAAVLYWVMSAMLELMQVRIERYYGRGFKGERTRVGATTPIPPRS